MSLKVIHGSDREELFVGEERLIADGLEQDKRVCIVAEHGTWVDNRRLLLHTSFPLGLAVSTWDHFFEEAWYLYGSGEEIVSSNARLLLLDSLVRTGLTDNLGFERFPQTSGHLSRGFLAQLADFVNAAKTLPEFEAALQDLSTCHDGQENLSAIERAIMRLLALYFEELPARGLIEPADAQRFVAQLELRNTLIVFEGFERLSRRQSEVLIRFAQENEVVVALEFDRMHPGRMAALPFFETLMQAGAEVVGGIATSDSLRVDDIASEASAKPAELQQLTERLFTAHPGIDPQGHVHVGEAHGAHAEPALIASLAEQAMREGFSPGDIAVVLHDVATSADPLLFNEFAVRRIPFTATFRSPFGQTAFGCALLGLYNALCDDEADPDYPYRQFCAFIASPFSGILQRDAWALQKKWRQRRKGSSAQRFADAQALDGRLAVVIELAQRTMMSRTDRRWADDCFDLATYLLENGIRSLRRSEENSIDDRAAAQAFVNYAQSVADIDGVCTALDIESLSVELHRSYGVISPNPCALADDSPGSKSDLAHSAGSGTKAIDAVRLCTAGDMALASYPVVILCNLTADAYPMSVRPGPVEGFLEKFAITTDTNVAQSQRSLLVHLIESARQRFVFCRTCNDLSGDESRQSALWDELMSNYRTPVDERNRLKPHEVPVSLRPYLTSISESGNTDALPVASAEQRLWRRELGAADPSREREGRLANLEGLSIEMFARGALATSENHTALIPTVFSVTELETYVRCPYNWFITRKLDTREIDRDFGPSEKGSLAHHVLKRFYERFASDNPLGSGIPRRVDPDNLDEARQTLSICFDTVLEEEREKSGAADASERPLVIITSAYERSEAEGMRKSLLQLIERDATFLPNFTPTYLECPVGSGHIDPDGEEGSGRAFSGQTSPLEYAGVSVRGCIDRIDVREADRGETRQAVIIDYKMSSSLSDYGIASKTPLYPTHIQGAIYALLAQRSLEVRVLGTLYRSYRAAVTRGVYQEGLLDIGGVAGDDETLIKTQELSRNDALPWQNPVLYPAGSVPAHCITYQTYSDYLKQVEQQVFQAVERMRSGAIAPDPLDRDICTYCPVNTTCPKRRSR